MAVPTGTYQTFQQKGIREDLEDKIYRISPTETPFLTMAKRGKATAAKHEWQIDALASADGTNAVVEGDDAQTNTASPTTRLANHTQLMDKVVRVSSRANAVNTAGRKQELALQVAKRSLELKRDMETRLTGNYGATVGSATKASQLAGLSAWYTTNDSRGTGGQDGGWNGSVKAVAATDASATNIRTFTETRLKTVIKNVWTAGGDPGIVLVGGSNKQKASAFGGIATQYRENSGRKHAVILGAADVYISDFGEHRIVPDRFSRDRDAHVLDMEYWEVCYLQPFKVEELAKTGHSERRMISVEFTLASRNEAASGIVADLSTA